MQNQRLLESSWDYCVVLDACRYDAFADLHDAYLDGTLERRWSPGSSTPEWAARTFTGSHDIAYFSGNPFINDLGIPLADLAWGASCDYRWTANEHISNVVDVWDYGWDDDIGTVPPEGLERAFCKHRDVAGRAERVILHYMQPHAPYLTRGTGRKLRRIQKGIRNQDGAANAEAESRLQSIGNAVRPKVEAALEGSRLAQKAGVWLELDPMTLVRNSTRETLRARYRENLHIVLESVAELTAELDGTIVITADHGEAFGEHGVWEHHVETHIPPLMEVPWFELE
ncbi:hypothetical protein [Halopiger djelfimassiliensis]|uniref:hypothetical protein n=1 Tax=Halopiger djelfimassiliensis TaxID=1293047 RepID=UPI000677C999|nr:hypothetical protein [Halopiger djelfimassiliensis]